MSDLMREEFEKKYKAPTGCYWNSMTGEYTQSWYELEGDDVIDKEIRIHNDRFLTWKASRECLVIELPPSIGVTPIGGDGIQEFIDCNGEYLHGHLVVDALTAAGVKYK